MIVIKHIDFLEVPEDFADIHHWTREPKIMEVGTADGTELMLSVTILEHIKGIRLTRPDGQTLVVGTSKQAAEVIGIQYEAWEGDKELLKYYAEKCELQGEQIKLHNERLDLIESMPFWVRLKWLFTGIKTRP